MSTFDGVINKAKSFINVTGKKTKLQMEKLNKESELQKNMNYWAEFVMQI